MEEEEGMHAAGKTAQLIITDDDEDDYNLAKSAFERAGLRNPLIWVKNGQELLDFLQRRGAYAGSPRNIGPRLIILDLNMPGMDGREALALIKAEPTLRRIPVIIMTTAASEEDVGKSYGQGVCSFIRKPMAFDDFVQAAGVIKKYWLELVELPGPGEGHE